MSNILDYSAVDDVRKWREQVVKNSGAKTVEELSDWMRSEIKKLDEAGLAYPFRKEGKIGKNPSPTTESSLKDTGSAIDCEAVREVREWRGKVAKEPSRD